MSPPDLLERKKGYSRYFEEPLIDKHSRGSHSHEDKGTKFTKNHQQKIKNTIVEYRVYMEQRIKNIYTNSKYSNTRSKNHEASVYLLIIGFNL